MAILNGGNHKAHPVVVEVVVDGGGASFATAVGSFLYYYNSPLFCYAPLL